MEDIRLAWKNLWRNRRRTAITLAAVAISVMLVQTFHNLSIGTYRRMVDSGVRAGSGHLAVYRGDYVRSRDESLTFDPDGLPSQIEGDREVQAVLPRVYLPGLAQSSRESRGILLTGVDPAVEQAVNPFLRGLAPEKRIRTPNDRDAVLGARLLRELKIEEGHKFVVTVQSRGGELASELFRVRGVVSTGIKDVDGSLIMVGRQRAAAMAGVAGQVHELAIVLETPEADRRVQPVVTELLAGREDLRVIPWEEAMPNLANTIKLDYVSQKFIFVVIVLIVTIGVVNTLLMSVMERVREFGVILALGATPMRLRRMILAEAGVLGAVAMALGSLLGSAATWYLVEVGIDLRALLPEGIEAGGVVFEPILRATWDVPWMAEIALYVVILSLLASLYPAIKAARIAPAEAMRHT